VDYKVESKGPFTLVLRHEHATECCTISHHIACANILSARHKTMCGATRLCNTSAMNEPENVEIGQKTCSEFVEKDRWTRQLNREHAVGHSNFKHDLFEIL